ncbi:unnamed protein product [Cochlearia groenlandica]
MNVNRNLRSEPKTMKVWRRNIDEAMVQFGLCLKRFPLIAFDTEYPGVIHRTYIDSSEEERYSAMKANVESTKLIQCGFTLFNADGEIGGTWEFNFSNFGDPSDTRNEVSMEFLKRHGLDLNKIRRDGVDMFGYAFFPKLLSLFHSQRHFEFVTFQGAYDIAYFLCILCKGKLPETSREFASQVEKVFGDVYDLKVMAGHCQGLGEHLGLSKLAKILNIGRVGRAHHAGSDSLMTARVFIRFKQLYVISKSYKGILYGIGKRNPVTEQLLSPVSVVPPLTYPQNLVSYPSSNLMFQNGYVPNYDTAPLYYTDITGVQWVIHNGMYVNQLNHHQHLPSTTFAYPTQTSYAAAADYNLGPFLNYNNNNTACFN